MYLNILFDNDGKQLQPQKFNISFPNAVFEVLCTDIANTTTDQRNANVLCVVKPNLTNTSFTINCVRYDGALTRNDGNAIIAFAIGK